MYQNIYDGLIADAKKILDVASLLKSQQNLIEQLKKSLPKNGGLIYRIEKISETCWKITTNREENGKGQKNYWLNRKLNQHTTPLMFSGKNEDFTGKQTEKGSENIKFSIFFREKENRYMGRFTFLKRRYCVYGKTYNDCLNNCRQKHKNILYQKMDDQVANSNILKKWLEYYLENVKKPQLKESTYAVLMTLYDRHLKKHKISNTVITKITTIALKDFIGGIKSTTAKKRMHHLLNETFDMTQKMGIIKTNPMAFVIVPRAKEIIAEANTENKILSCIEEKLLFEKLKNAACYHAVKFILYTGLRRGECIGLMWKHIDFDNMTITINQQWNENTKKITTTKSKAGNRIIPILPQALEVLKELNATPHSDNDFIFRGINRLTQQLVAHSKSLPFKVNPHMLRHTFASRCYFAGLDPKRLQSILGHEAMSTTLDTYTHIVEPDDNDVIKGIREFFISIKYII